MALPILLGVTWIWLILHVILTPRVFSSWSLGARASRVFPQQWDPKDTLPALPFIGVSMTALALLAASRYFNLPFLQGLVMLLGLIWIFSHWSPPRKFDMPCRDYGFMDAITAILLPLPLVWTVGSTVHFLNHGMDGFSLKAPMVLPAFVYFQAVIFMPVAEEWIFRQGIYGRLRELIGSGWAMLISSTFFTAFHGYSSSFPALLTLSIATTLAYERTGKLRYPILAHILYNAVFFLLKGTGQFPL